MPTTRILTTEALPGLTPTSIPGRYLVRLIDAGEGSSAYYPPEVLQQAAADRIFAAGTRMHLDHPTDEEAKQRPIRSVKDWASTLLEDARYNPDSQALEAPVKVLAPYRPLVDGLKEDVGLSIRAMIEARPGDAPGGKPVAERFLASPINSVDWVTAAGRGGKVLQVLEAAAPVAEATTRERREQLQIALKAAYAPGDDQYVWVRDFDEELNLVWFEDQSERCWQQQFTPAADDLSVALAGDPVEVRPTTTYVPVNTTPEEGAAGQPETTHQKEQKMPEISQARLDELTAIEARAAQMQTERDAAVTRAESAESERDEIKTKQAHADAVAEAMKSVQRDEPVKSRIQEALEAHIGGLTDAVVEAAVKREDEYLAAATGQRHGPSGFGKTTVGTESATPKRTTSAWGTPLKKEI